MATQQSATAIPTGNDSLPEWAGWIAALFGLWVFVSPFVLSGSFGTGTPFYSNVVAGIVIAVLAGFTAYTVRTD